MEASCCCTEAHLHKQGSDAIKYQEICQVPVQETMSQKMHMQQEQRALLSGMLLSEKGSQMHTISIFGL